MREIGSNRRRARKAREVLNRQDLTGHGDELKWEIDEIGCVCSLLPATQRSSDIYLDYGLDLVLGTTSTDMECLNSTCQRSSSVFTTGDNSARLDMHPVASKADPTRLGLFDLPTELRVRILELYCLSFGSRNTEPEPFRGRQTRELPHAALLKPQLVCHQLRHEFMDVWATSTTFDLPLQWIQWPWSRKREEPEELARDKTIQQLYLVVRDWLEGMPNNLRHRLRRLRLAFVTPKTSWGTGLRTTECLLEMKGVIIARLMERLDVHQQLRIEVGIGVEKYCCATHRWLYKEVVQFELKQRSAGEVQEKGGDEWVCVEEQRRKTETRYCRDRTLRENLITIV